VIHVPINTRYGRVELEHLFNDCTPKAIWLHDALSCAPDVKALAADLNMTLWQETQQWLSPHAAECLEEVVDMDDDDVAMLIYTSGTTGKSKGCALSYRAILSNIWHLSSAWDFAKEDKLVLALPLFHVHGLCLAAHSALWHSATLLLEKKFSPKSLSDLFAHEGATVFMGVPTMYHRILGYMNEHPQVAAAFSRARLFTSGSAALSPAHFTSFFEATGHRILERYGMSETLLTLSNPYDGERRAGTVGLPVVGVRAEIRDAEGDVVAQGDSGTLWVQGDSLMNGYWNNPQATANDFHEGYFKTGDCVARDEAGYYRIVGRDSVDILKVGGFKIGAREIEEVLESHDAVEEAAVIGVSDEEWGQRIEAFVVLPKNTKITSNTLKNFIQGRIAGYKIPGAYFVVSALPRNALGKLQKHRLDGLRAQAHGL
jgi:acyl-CoA synthetase (AMP-forming)/AMP-acid ligase II